MNDDNIIKALEEWFNKPIKYKRWSRNGVGKYLRTKLIELGPWKNKRRGSPNKAIKAMRKSMERKEFEQTPFEFE